MGHRVSWLDAVFVWISRVGTAGLVWIAIAVAVGLATRRSLPLLLAVTVVGVWTADLVALGLKSAFDRPRPFVTIPADDPIGGLPSSASMPSGHAATAFAAAVVLSYAVPRAAPAFVALALAIAYSRVYLGLHYVFDVVAGGALGAAAGAAVLLGLRRPLRLAESLRPRRRSPTTG